MLTASQRQRFRALQNGDENGALSAEEQAELQAFVQLIEDKEAVYLHPATEHIQQERLQIEERNRALLALIQQKEQLVQRMERMLASSKSEQEKITEHLTAILNTNSASTAR